MRMTGQPPTNPDLTALLEVIRKHAPEQAIERALVRYTDWSNLPSLPTSHLNHRLYLLELVEEESHDRDIKNNEAVVDAVLNGSGVRKVGDVVDGFTRDGDNGPWTVIWRQIGAHYGFELGFQSVTGKLFSWEFFD